MPPFSELLGRRLAAPAWDRPDGLREGQDRVGEAVRDARRFEFLADAGRVLVSSLDYDTTLNAVARLAIPTLADFCTVFVVEEGREARRVALAHREPEVEIRLRELLPQYPGPKNPRSLSYRVLETGQPVVLRHMSLDVVDEMYERAPEIADYVRSLMPRSAMSLPLRVRDQVLGALNFSVSEPRLPYGPEDVALARELAQLAALAIAHARLYQAERRAVAVRDEVLSIVSHDLRTPLNAVSVSTSVLASLLGPDGAATASPGTPGLDAPTRGIDPGADGRDERATSGGEDEPASDALSPVRHLGIIRRAVHRMNRLIDDLLDAARMDAGSFSLDRVPLDLSRVIGRTLDLLEPQAGAAGLELAWVGERDLATVLGDGDRIMQVLTNLVGNAVKFTAPGGSIELRTATGSDEVRITVTDTGAGIPADRLERLFDRFWRDTASAGHGPRGGAGLGLWIARGIVEAHGGRIWAESRVGVGSRFIFTLPRADDAAERHVPSAA
ncbi:MAG: GAF domain-containing sensor histidine kinase [Gemmatimonadota bacterium]